MKQQSFKSGCGIAADGRNANTVACFSICTGDKTVYAAYLGLLSRYADLPY